MSPEPEAKTEPAVRSADEDQGRRGGLHWMIWLALAALFYVLSIGPVCKLCVAGSLPDWVIEIYWLHSPSTGQ